MSADYLMRDLIVRANRLDVVVCRNFSRRFLLGNFFAEYDEDVNLEKIDPLILQIPFLLNILPVVWLSGEKYRIAKIDRQFAESLQLVKMAYRRMYPELEWLGELLPDEVTEIDLESSKVPNSTASLGIFFSGGVDSTCTSLSHLQKKQLLITVWGGNIALENRDGWSIVTDHCRQFGKTYGHRNTFIRSNFSRFLYTSKLKTYTHKIPNWWTHVQHGIGLVGLAAPVMYRFGIRKLLIASTHNNEFHAEWGSSPSIENNLKWPGAIVEHDGAELSRQAKLAKIVAVSSNLDTPKPFLYVCSCETRRRGDNCCECEKCLRTIIGLLIENQNVKDYGFDTSPTDALNAARTRFDERTMPIDDNAAFYWSDLQARVRESKSHPNVNIDSEFPNLFDWLVNINVEKYQEEYLRQNLGNIHATAPLRSYTKFILNRIPVIDRRLQRAIARYHFWSRSRK